MLRWFFFRQTFSTLREAKYYGFITYLIIIFVGVSWGLPLLVEYCSGWQVRHLTGFNLKF
jgi:hypothetical protein